MLFRSATGRSSCTACGLGWHGSVLAAAGRTTQANSCTQCSAGHFSSTGAQETCDECASGSFAGQQGSSQCTPWTTCSKGQRKYGNDRYADGGCADCAAGTFQAFGNSLVSVCGECGIGEDTRGETRSEGCTTCAFETFKTSEAAGTDSCVDTRKCTAQEWEVTAPTTISDRECFALTECPNPEKFVATAASLTSDRSCGFASTCAAGYHIVDELAATSDRTCAQNEQGSFTSGQNQDTTQVQQWQECQACAGMTKEGTATSDRECATCATGFFSASVGNQACEAIDTSPCPDGHEQVNPGSACAQRVCEPCSLHGSQYWSTGGAACQPWTNCGPGKGVLAEGTSTSDRTCRDCETASANGLTEWSTSNDGSACNVEEPCSVGSGLVQAGTTTSARV